MRVLLWLFLFPLYSTFTITIECFDDSNSVQSQASIKSVDFVNKKVQSVFFYCDANLRKIFHSLRFTKF